MGMWRAVVHATQEAGGALGHSLQSRRAAILVALLAVTVYLPGLQYGFVWDDLILAQHNQFLQQHSDSVRFLSRDFSELTFGALGGSFYRPLLSLTLWADARVWGQDPTGFHVTNLLLHGLVVVLLWLVVKRLSDPGTATLTALLFAVHPAHSEVAVFISGRVDSLALLPMLAGVWLFLQLDCSRSPRERLLLHLGLLGAFGLALAAKESAVVFPALLLIVGVHAPADAGRQRVGRLRTTVMRAAGVLVALAAYAAWRRVALVGYLAQPSGAPEAVRRVWVAAEAFGYYTLQALLPIPLGPERYPAVPPSPWNLPVSFGFACFLLVAFWLFWAWRRRPIVATGLLWFVLALAPALAALPVNTAGQFVLAERWLYTASAGMMLALAATAMPWLTDLGNVARVRRTGAALLAWASLGLGALLWITPIWESNTTLYRYLLHRNPTALGPLINVATLEMQAGQPEAAMALVRHAVAIAPGDATAWLNLGMALRDLRRYDEAMAAFRTSVQLNPAWIIPPMYMSSVYFDTGRYAEGIALMRAVVRRAPMFAHAHLFLGGFYEEAGRLEDAVASYREAIRLNPMNRNAFQCLARTHVRMGAPQAAVATLEAGLAALPGNHFIQLDLARLYDDMGQTGRARPLWEALSSLPGDQELSRLAAERLAR